MGRPERALDPDNGPVEQFANDLRRLRQEAGSPSYRDLADKARYSASVLSRAASGRELPSLPVTLAYVGACGGDTELWAARWHSLQPDRQEQSQPGTPHQPMPSLSGGPRRYLATGPRRYLITGLALLAVIAAVAAWAATLPSARHPKLAASRHHGPALQSPPQSPSPSSSRSTAPGDGDDPKADGCVADATTVASAEIRVTEPAVAAGLRFAPGTVIGTVELRYSPRCHAAWGRVTPTVAFDHPKSGREALGVTRPSDGAAAPFEPGDVEEAYGDLLTTGHGCLVAYAKFMIADGHVASARTACWQPR
ncbi:MAG TPA: DUF2690 domain-containing protein [Streptosporangiaceae bacterium]|nr:DUF2690 domain-containing protein [Streptosporangiaceae bacterium]